MMKISVCYTLCLIFIFIYDLHLWYTCMYKRIISPGIFFIFFKILIFRIIRMGEVKRKKWSKRTKKILCITLYIRNCTSYDCNFWCTCVKSRYLQQILSFFKILDFGVFRGIKGKK